MADFREVRRDAAAAQRRADSARRILASTPAGHFPAEEQAQQFRDQGIPATVVQDLPADRFLVVVPEQGEAS